MQFCQLNKIQSGWYPVADAYEKDTNQALTDVFNMSKYNHITFIIHEGVGTTGTATITVESCDDTTPTTATAIVFDYYKSTTADTFSDRTRAATTGFATTAGSNHIYVIEVDATMLSGTDKYVRLKATELVDAAVLAGCIAIQSEPRYAADGAGMPGALT